jgi:LacI family transcriptional regulator
MQPTPLGDAPRHPPTRSDVARHAGVSTAVVSYVVNNGPRPVAPATRQRVLDSMSALGYRPNAVARALRLRRATAIGLVLPDVSNTYFGALARELSDRAFTAGYALLLGDSNNDPDRERAQIESLVSHQVDGLIVLSLAPGSTAELRETPTVYLDQRSRPGQASIVIDNTGGARAAVEHLAGHGRRRIAHLGGLAGSPGADDRAQADYSREGGHAAARDLLSRRPRADAVFVASDVQALGLLLAARELGIAVPDDLAVVSFDGTEDAVFSDPPLTAIEQPLARIADAALSTVLGQVHPDGRQEIPVDLVIRRSCGCHG